MCLIALAWCHHPRFRLVIAANRDEAHARPSADAAFDPDASDVYGGRDLVQGGGWLQVSRRGRLAAVTNVRAGHDVQTWPRSRGWLVRDFVRGTASPGAYADALLPVATEHGRFNLLTWQDRELAFASNHPQPARFMVAPGVHAMSNGPFDAPWPKSMHATAALDSWLESAASRSAKVSPALVAPLFDALADTQVAPDACLPDTGVGLDLERRLSPPFVAGAMYGTRCSSVVLVDDQSIVFAERRFGPGGRIDGDSLVVLPMMR